MIILQVALLATSLLIQGHRTEWPGQAGTWRASAAGSIDALSIVVPTRINPLAHRLAADGSQVELASEDVTVLESVLVLPGTRLNVLVSVGSLGEPRMMPTGARCLLLAHAVHDSSLEWPMSTSVGPRPDVRLPATSAHEVTGLAWFETKKARLDGTRPNAETMIGSVVSCLDGSSDEQTERVCTYLINAFYPGWTPSARPQTDFPLSKRLFAYGQSGSSWRQAMIAGVRNRWKIIGSDREVDNALMACATDPRAFPSDSIFLGGPTEFVSWDSNGRRVPPAITADQYVRVVSTATNERVLCYWLKRLPKMDDAHERVVAQRLLDSDPEVQRLVAQHLAKSYNEPEKGPHGVASRGADTAYPDLDRSVAYWRSKFGI